VTLPLGLRNRLAELILDAFDDPGARRALCALDAWCAADDAPLSDEDGARLQALDWFTAGPDGRLTLLGAHRAHRDALCRRAAAGRAALPRATPAEADPRDAALARAARLADRGLHFEVHELLEPLWLRAEGQERVGLQGLIQAAVALHHAAGGNREGALSLLVEARLKLPACREALGLDTDAFVAGLDRAHAALSAGRPLPALPPWPTPSVAV
jgi:hypothetical protein